MKANRIFWRMLGLAVFFVCGLVSSPTLTHADGEPLERYVQAQKAYYAADYTTARTLFLELLTAQPHNGYLLYNLANVYFKADDLGLALQHYEKARRLIPRFTDLQFNLDLARTRLTDQVDTTLSDYLAATFYFWAQKLTLAEYRLALLLAAGLFWGLLIVKAAQGRRLLRFYPLILLTFFSYLLLGYVIKSQSEIEGGFAIVLADKVAVRATYMEGDQPLFELHEGTRVQVIDRQPFGGGHEWVRIRMPAGQKGWVLATDLGVI